MRFNMYMPTQLYNIIDEQAWKKITKNTYNKYVENTSSFGRKGNIGNRISISCADKNKDTLVMFSYAEVTRAEIARKKYTLPLSLSHKVS